MDPKAKCGIKDDDLGNWTGDDNGICFPSSIMLLTEAYAKGTLGFKSQTGPQLVSPAFSH